MHQRKCHTAISSPGHQRLERQLRRVEILIVAVAARHGLGHGRCQEVAERFLELAANLRQIPAAGEGREERNDSIRPDRLGELPLPNRELIRMQFEQIAEILSEQENGSTVYRRMMNEFASLERTHRRYFSHTRDMQPLGVGAEWIDSESFVKVPFAQHPSE